MDVEGKPGRSGPINPAALGTPLTVRIESRPAAQIVHLAGTVAIHQSDELREQLRSVLTPSTPNLVLNLRDLEFVSSMGIAAIVAAHNDARNRGGRAALVSPRPAIAKLLSITRVDRLIPVYPSLEAALDALPQGG
jgi:anti-sigma B factor antagonist